MSDTYIKFQISYWRASEKKSGLKKNLTTSLSEKENNKYKVQSGETMS